MRGPANSRTRGHVRLAGLTRVLVGLVELAACLTTLRDQAPDVELGMQAGNCISEEVMNGGPASEDIGAGDPDDVFGETIQQRRQISSVESIDVSTDEMLVALHPPRVRRHPGSCAGPLRAATPYRSKDQSRRAPEDSLCAGICHRGEFRSDRRNATGP